LVVVDSLELILYFGTFDGVLLSKVDIRTAFFKYKQYKERKS